MIGIAGFPLRKATSMVTALALLATLSTQGASAVQASQPGPQSRLQIQHDPLACVTTTAGAAVDAQVNPGPEVSTSRVLWRAAKKLPYFYYTPMTGTPPSVEGIIPRPEETTTAVEYNVEAIDRASLSRKTPDYVAPVLASNVCQAKGIVPPIGGLGLTIGLTDPKQPPVPPGFRKEDIAKVILVTGAIVTLAVAMQMMGGTAAAGAGAGAAGAGTGGAGAGAAAGAGGAAAAGGISTGVLVGAGVAAAAGVAVAASSKGGSSNPTATPPPTATPIPTPTRTPVVNHFLEADVTWSGPENIQMQLTAPAGAPSPQVIPVGCGSAQNSRTARIVLEGPSVPSGSYQVALIGEACGTTPTPIIALLQVQTDNGPIAPCTSFFSVPVSVPTGPAVKGCSFTLP